MRQWLASSNEVEVGKAVGSIAAEGNNEAVENNKETSGRQWSMRQWVKMR